MSLWRIHLLYTHPLMFLTSCCSRDVLLMRQLSFNSHDWYVNVCSNYTGVIFYVFNYTSILFIVCRYVFSLLLLSIRVSWSCMSWHPNLICGKIYLYSEYDTFVCHCCLVIPFPSDLTVPFLCFLDFVCWFSEPSLCQTWFLDVPVTDVLILWNICVTND